MSLMAPVLENPETGERFVDRKRYLWLMSAVYPLAPLFFIVLAYTTGWAGWLWAMPVAFYGVVTLLDHITGEDTNNPPEWAVPMLEEDRFYRYLVYAAVPGQFATLVASAWAVGSGVFPLWGIAGLAVSMGIIGAFALNLGHELGHKKTESERWLAKLVLTTVAYGHFFIEHNKGHHRDVATPEDPASSRMGENLYQFMLREIPGAARRAWRIEAERMQRKGRSVFSLDNEIVQTGLMTAVLYGALTWAFGWVVLPFLVVQAALGWFHLTLANYIEHYGLLRQKLPSGRYERCSPEHSWNTNHITSNLILFHLQRHSDHHANPTRRYQSLRNFEGLPTLPSGYPGMWLAAMVPPVWRAIMDKRLLAHYGHDMTRVNVDPAKREALFARHHRPREENAAA